MKKEICMNRKIGSLSIYILIFHLICSVSKASVKMSFLDMNEEPLKRAAVGVPFIIEVSVSDQKVFDRANITIQGIDQFVLQSRNHESTVNTIINGVSTHEKIMRYIVKAPKEGVFTIGPATTMINQQKVESAPIKIVVAKEADVKKNEPALQFLVDTDVVYVGQKVSCMIRFFTVPNAQLLGITEPQFNDMIATKLEGPFSGSVEVEGVMRDYAEWRCSLTPLKTGKVEIPAVAAVYRASMPRRRTSNIFDFDAFSVFSKPSQERQIFSNALSFEVRTLPPFQYAEKVFGLGAFQYDSFTVEPVVAKEGEGVVARLVVLAQGMVTQFPQLQLPDGLKYYESKKYMDETTKNATWQKFIFEYIIQGVKSGDYAIESQTLYYFDLQQKKYFPLKTNPIHLKIIAFATQHTLKKDTDPQEEKQLTEKPIIQKNNVVDTNVPYNNQPVANIKINPMQWGIFVMIIAIVLLMALFISLVRWYKSYVQRNALFIRKRKAFVRAHACLRYIKRDKRADGLYDVFITLFADKFMVEKETVDISFMDNVIRKSFLDMHTREMWDNFIHAILHQTYGITTNGDEQIRLIEEAIKWVKILERAL